MQWVSAETPSEIVELARCPAVFVPGVPARTGRVAFWHPDGAVPPVLVSGSGSVEDVSVVRPTGAGGVELVRMSALLLPVQEALHILTRARAAPEAHRAVAFWGAAALAALEFTARGLLLPGLSPDDHDVWRAAPWGPTTSRRCGDWPPRCLPRRTPYRSPAPRLCGCPIRSGCCEPSWTRSPTPSPAPPPHRS